MLVVVCIVALLTGAILRKNVLPAGVAARAAKDAPAGEAGGAAAPVAPADGATAAPADAVGRARGLEDSVRRQAADREQRIDAGTK